MSGCVPKSEAEVVVVEQELARKSVIMVLGFQILYYTYIASEMWNLRLTGELPEYLSDLGGNDPDAHHEDPHQVLMIVRDFLQSARRGKPLPGRAALVAAFDRFKRAIPIIAEGIEHGAGEIGVRKNFPTFVWCLTEFLKRVEE